MLEVGTQRARVFFKASARSSGIRKSDLKMILTVRGKAQHHVHEERRGSPSTFLYLFRLLFFFTSALPREDGGYGRPKVG